MKVPSGRLRISAMVQIAPVVGVVALGWQVFPVLAFFWLENVVQGLFHALLLAVAPLVGIPAAGRLFLVPFFLVHYGIFCLVHGAFLWVLFSSPEGVFHGPIPLHQALAGSGLWWAGLWLLIGQAIAFLVHDLPAARARPQALVLLMLQPYRRVVQLHLTILFGALLVILLGSSLPALLILIGLRIAMEGREMAAKRTMGDS